MDALADYCVNVSLTTSKILQRALTIQENAYLVDLIKATKMRHSHLKLADYAAKKLKKLADIGDDVDINKEKIKKQDTKLIDSTVDMHLYLNAKVKQGSSIPKYNSNNQVIYFIGRSCEPSQSGKLLWFHRYKRYFTDV